MTRRTRIELQPDPPELAALIGTQSKVRDRRLAEADAVARAVGTLKDAGTLSARDHATLVALRSRLLAEAMTAADQARAVVREDFELLRVNAAFDRFLQRAGVRP